VHSLEEQTAIAQVLQAVDKEICLLKAKAEKLREQKKGLMQVLLTEKIRLFFDMPYNPNIHNRKSIRLMGYDYSQAGWYFITICVQNRLCLFGEIVNGEMMLNDAGRMVENEWLKLPQRFANIELHEYVVMPNHFHAIMKFPQGRPLWSPKMTRSPKILNRGNNHYRANHKGLPRPNQKPLVIWWGRFNPLLPWNTSVG
jgi:REP element-mobilizing transposase RayT